MGEIGINHNGSLDLALALVAAYRQAVADAIGHRGDLSNPGRYFAHRREDPAKVAAIARMTGLEPVKAPLPLEVALRQGPVASRVVCFPSTPAFTLPLVLAGLPVEVETIRLEPAWLAPSAPDRARAFLLQLDGLARGG
ncbi:MAG: hypothetical protein LBR27_03835 [Bifidobacteriaceae bacterium]|nr:hypothetical protein [Bifidobacteriaceae bacterium]